MATVYLLHFDPPYRHMKHYLGVTERRVNARLAEHRMGAGGRTTRLAVEAGCKLELARVWEDVPKSFEWQVKGRGAREMCPICNPGYNSALPAVRRVDSRLDRE